MMKFVKIELYIRDFFFFVALLFMCFLFLFTLHKQNQTIKALEQLTQSNNLIQRQLILNTLRLDSLNNPKFKTTVVIIPVDYPSSELFKLALFQGSKPFKNSNK